MKEDFLNMVKEHEMRVLLDSGVHRCVRFAKPGGRIENSFTLTTWPGHLCISGDRGTWVFARVHDMFEFFRGDGISAGYWAEKIVAADRYAPRSDGTAFCPQSTKQNVLEECQVDADDLETAFYESNDVRVYDALGDLGLDDVGELLVYQHTNSFLVCLHAIAWGIAQYDARESVC